VSEDASADRSDSHSDDLAWETLESSIDYTCPGFDVRLDRVRYPDGREGEFHSVSEPESVVVLPFTPGDELVVISEWRQAVGRVSYGLPAGSAEPEDDDLAETARRELTEETGYVAESVEPLLAVEPINGVADVVHNYFVATGCRPDGEQDLDHNESIRVETTTYGALLENVLAGRVRDGRTVTGVLYYDSVRSV
jgi:ADP-ribose pyrophosphatase